MEGWCCAELLGHRAGAVDRETRVGVLWRQAAQGEGTVFVVTGQDPRVHSYVDDINIVAEILNFLINLSPIMMIIIIITMSCIISCTVPLRKTL